MRAWICALWIVAAALSAEGAAAQTSPGAQPSPPAPATPTSPAGTQAPPAAGQPQPQGQAQGQAENQAQGQAQGQAQDQNQAQKQAPTAQKFRAPDGELKMSQILGATVMNDQNQQIGTISDVLLDKDLKADRTVLSVGGFLGVGSRLVQVPFAHLKIEADKIILPGATKVSLENLSAYQAQ